MFIGHYQSAFAPNDHLEIPVVFRELLAGRVVVTQGFDRNIMVLPVDVFQNLTRLVMSLNIADPLARTLQRLLIGNASYSTIDQAGNISLPATLKDFAQLTSEVILVGQGNFFEIWSQGSWRQQELTLQDADANSQRFASVNLAGL